MMKTTHQTENRYPRFIIAYLFLVIFWSALILWLAIYQFGLDYQRAYEMANANAADAYNHDRSSGNSVSTTWESLEKKLAKHKLEMGYSFAGIWLAGIIGFGVFMFIINKNLRKQKKLQTILERGEQKYRTLFTQISLGMAIHEAIYDTSGKITDFRFLEVNKSFENILGFKASEIIGKSVLEVFPGIEKNLLEKFVQVASSGTTLKYDHYIAVPGKYLDVLAYQTQPGQVALVFNDITDRKLSEEKIIRSESELKELNATKDKFFSIIAHDLKSPFSSIVGFSEILVTQAHKKTRDEIENYAKIIMNASMRAMDMLVNLIEWSRSQTRKTEVYIENFSLPGLVDGIIFQFSDTALEKSITITKKLPEAVMVNSDQTILNSVFRNLISNALKFTKPGGEVVISAEIKDDHILVSVKDNGIGIPEDEIGSLFRIDENYSRPGTANETGTGLGLILCKELIVKLGGKIRVESLVGRGSTFSISLPQSRNV